MVIACTHRLAAGTEAAYGLALRLMFDPAQY
jgi:hypothetical protein